MKYMFVKTYSGKKAHIAQYHEGHKYSSIACGGIGTAVPVLNNLHRPDVCKKCHQILGGDITDHKWVPGTIWYGIDIGRKDECTTREPMGDTAAYEKGFGDDKAKTAAYNKRGQILQEALDIINGERQDQYGDPEDSFALIAELWELYRTHKKPGLLNKKDVALMMTLFKLAREMYQGKRDNLRDGAGYLGIAGDMREEDI